MVVKLKKLLQEINDDELIKKGFAKFHCERDRDIESFLVNDSITYERMGDTATYLDFERKENNEVYLKGYFSLALKVFNIGEAVSNAQLKKLTHGRTRTKTIPAYLIGQLGKNDGAEKGYGVKLLQKALDIICEAKERVGGALVYVDCKDALVGYYEKQGFKHLQKDADNIYNQMYMII